MRRRLVQSNIYLRRYVNYFFSLNDQGNWDKIELHHKSLNNSCGRCSTLALFSLKPNKQYWKMTQAQICVQSLELREQNTEDGVSKPDCIFSQFWKLQVHTVDSMVASFPGLWWYSFVSSHAKEGKNGPLLAPLSPSLFLQIYSLYQTRSTLRLPYLT